MTITAYTFSKKHDSTSIPDISTPSHDFNVALKEGTSILHPTFRLSNTGWTSNYNYMSATFFNKKRYYFVRDVIQVTNGMLEVSCDYDPLGSWLLDIVQSTQFVERAEYDNIVNEKITDVAQVATVDHLMNTVSISNVLDYSNGYFVLGVIGDGLVTYLQRGMIKYVAMDAAQFNVLVQLLNTLTYQAGDLNPLQYFTSCVYIPKNKSLGTAVTSTWAMGSYSIGPISYYSLASIPYETLLASNFVTLPSHPQIARGAYMNYAPWASYHMFAAPFGDFEIPTDLIPSTFIIEVKAVIDECTGEGRLMVTGAGNILIDITSTVGVPIELTQITSLSQRTTYQTIGHLASSVASAITLNVGASIGEMGAAIMSSYEGSLPTVSQMGSNGSFVSYYNRDFEIRANFHIAADLDKSRIGRPVMEEVALASIASGFVKCRNAHLPINGYEEEQRDIENYMNTGFYLE